MVTQKLSAISILKQMKEEGIISYDLIWVNGKRGRSFTFKCKITFLETKKVFVGVGEALNVRPAKERAVEAALQKMLVSILEKELEERGWTYKLIEKAEDEHILVITSEFGDTEFPASTPIVAILSAIDRIRRVEIAVDMFVGALLLGAMFGDI